MTASRCLMNFTAATVLILSWQVHDFLESGNNAALGLIPEYFWYSTQRQKSKTPLNKSCDKASLIKPSDARSSNGDSNIELAREQHERQWVLLVESEEPFRKKVGKYIAEEGGYIVTGVQDAVSAILVCRGSVRMNRQQKSLSNLTSHLKHPNCIVINALLSGSMSGLDCLKVIRTDPILEFIPVILLTVEGHVEDRLHVYDAGADALLSKPFDPTELLSVIDNLLSREKFQSKMSGSIAINESIKDTSLSEIKHELFEIKKMLRDLGVKIMSIAKGKMIESEKETYSIDSIHNELMEIKEGIMGIQERTYYSSNFVQSNPTIALETYADRVLPETHSKPHLISDEEGLLKLLEQGMTDKEIAAKTKVSVSQVAREIGGLLKKANVTKRTELVRWWVQQCSQSNQ